MSHKRNQIVRMRIWDCSRWRNGLGLLMLSSRQLLSARNPLFLLLVFWMVSSGLTNFPLHIAPGALQGSDYFSPSSDPVNSLPSPRESIHHSEVWVSLMVFTSDHVSSMAMVFRGLLESLEISNDLRDGQAKEEAA